MMWGMIDALWWCGSSLPQSGSHTVRLFSPTTHGTPNPLPHISSDQWSLRSIVKLNFISLCLSLSPHLMQIYSLCVHQLVRVPDLILMDFLCPWKFIIWSPWFQCRFLFVVEKHLQIAKYLSVLIVSVYAHYLFVVMLLRNLFWVRAIVVYFHVIGTNCIRDSASWGYKVLNLAQKELFLVL